MQVQDIMTRDVITVNAETIVTDVAKLLLQNRVSAVPVVDTDNQVLGIVSEGDLIRRPEIEGERPRSWWLRLMGDSREQAADYIKTHGWRAEDVMTREVQAVQEDTPIADVAQLLEQRHIKRAPVLRNGKLVGIVSRANLLHALATAEPAAGGKEPQSDRALRESILGVLQSQDWVTHRTLNVVVTDGVVEVWGWVESEQERKAIALAVENVPGVRSVNSHLGSVLPYARYV